MQTSKLKIQFTISSTRKIHLKLFEEYIFSYDKTTLQELLTAKKIVLLLSQKKKKKK